MYMNNDNRDMFYSGYQGMMPIPNMNMYPNQIYPNNPNDNTPNNIYVNNSSSYDNMDNRISRIENQIKQINNRLNRLESTYKSNNYNNEPDNNMYMM